MSRISQGGGHGPVLARLAGRRLLAVALLAACWVTVSGAWAGGPRLDGAFVQLDRQHEGWTTERWRREFATLSDLGLGTLVVQWCREPGLSHLAPAPDAPLPSTSTVATLLRLANEQGVELYLGLYHDPAFWTRIAAPAPEVQGYLRGLANTHLAVARELVTLASGAASFRGFYIPQEIDDLHWRKADKRALLADYLKTLHTGLRGLAPGAAVLVSTFAKGHTSPRGFAAAWAEWLAAAPLDAVLFQDGFGDGSHSAATLTRYLEELAALGGPTRLWSVVETFRVLEQGEGVFRADSAPFARVREQLAVAAPFSDRRVAFSLRYLSVAGDLPGAAALADGYRRYLVADR